MRPILLTFDLEYWFESLSLQKHLHGNERDSLTEFTDQLLNLLEINNSSATFFVTGKILDQEPEIIKKIHQAGHEIAAHSMDHKPLWVKTKPKFEQEIKVITEKIKITTGEKPIGHRAVNFSLDNKTKWALEVLAEYNFKYDSSILPISVRPNFTTVDNFNEIKVFSGGIYIRLIPWTIFKFLLKNKLKEQTACLYLHPFDFTQQIPNIKMPGFKKFIKYFNTKKTWDKLKYLVNNFTCLSIQKYYHEHPLN